MKQGRSIVEVAKELERQRAVRKDYIADTRTLTVKSDVHGNSLLAMDVGNLSEKLLLNELAHNQIAARLSIPQKYYNKMRVENPPLLDWNINEWFRKAPEKRMIRVLDGNVRAFLSDRYRRLDNLELADTVFPIIQEMKGAEIMSCEVTETNLYIKVINKKLKAEVGVGDVIQAGICISNSEVGLGSLKVEPLLYRLVCRNGLIVKDYAQRRYHVGKQIESDDTAYEIFADDTLQADDQAFFLKVRDTVKTAVDETKFQLSIEKFTAAKRESTGDDPIKTVELLADKYILNQNERGSILRHFIMAGDNSRFGLINAVTRASQDIADYNRATDLERLGGELLALPPSKKELVPTSETQHKPMKNITNVFAMAR